MPNRRILSLWFPRLGVERCLRQGHGAPDIPFAIVGDHGNMQVLTSLSADASAAGLNRGQPLRDAQAMCPTLLTRRQNPHGETQFLGALRRWAGKFSPWVAEEAPDGLLVDLTGCAHLFGGEAALLDQVEDDCADLGLTVQAGIADTAGAAWALARFAGQPLPLARSGDAIDQEAYATRARAAKRRHWERGGPAPPTRPVQDRPRRIADPGKTRAAIARLPVAALRIEPEVQEALLRLGLRRIEDLAGQPRAGLARRFGRGLVQRLDQAMGVEPEPISPAKPPLHFAVRLTLPDPIGLLDDIMAALDRLTPELCGRLAAKSRGARVVRLEIHRSDHTSQWFDIGLARPSADPNRIRPLLSLKAQDIDAGFGIDRLRLEAVVTEPLHARQHRGHLDAGADAAERLSSNTALDDLIGRVGARIGMDALTRFHPADSNIPEKAWTELAAAWSEPATGWSPAAPARPLVMWPPEPVTANDRPEVPLSFRWRRRDLTTHAAVGPERIAPEWWLDDPSWRSGVRDYWRVTTQTGETLWLYYAHGGPMSSGWFCQGSFA
ncbi:MAG: DNA polymerase Y family protein [Pseudomonadota bacterium]